MHLIIVRDDLAYIIHQHPPIGPDGQLHQTVTFPAPGPYRVLIDLYPNIPGGQPNFQLFKTVHVAGAYHPKSLPSFTSDQTIDGYHIDMHGHPSLKAIQAQFVDVNVTDPQGKKVTFVPWFGALAHAIFFHEGTLDYFHTHVCAPNAPELLHARRRHQDRREIQLPRQTHDRRAPTRTRHLATVPTDEARREGHHRPVHAEGEVVTPTQIQLRLLASAVALAAGGAAVVIAILLVRSVLG